MELITTTVSVDAQKAADQVIIHLVKGDSGTRRFQFVPIEGGHLIDMVGIDVAQVKMRAYSKQTTEALLINCTFDNAKRLIYMTPTAALVAAVDEWDCQLVLLDSDNQTLSSMPFTIIIHGTVYEGDVVEHTNVKLAGAYYDDTTKMLILELADGTQITVSLAHTHGLATLTEDGFLSKEQFAYLRQLMGDLTADPVVKAWVDQDVSTTGTPTFYAATIGTVNIAHDGTVTGMKFT